MTMSNKYKKKKLLSGNNSLFNFWIKFNRNIYHILEIKRDKELYFSISYCHYVVIDTKTSTCIIGHLSNLKKQLPHLWTAKLILLHYLSLAGINACYYLMYHKLHSSFQKHNICNHPCCCQLLLLHQLLQNTVY